MMKISFANNQKVIIIKHNKDNKDNNKQKIFNIINKSLEKYDYYLKFIEIDQTKSDGIINNSAKLNVTKKDSNLHFSAVEKIFCSKKSRNANQIKIYYKVSKTDKEVRIFGDDFVNNNKKNCYILNNGIKYPLKCKIKNIINRINWN